jgi:hypothetical protein
VKIDRRRRGAFFLPATPSYPQEKPSGLNRQESESMKSFTRLSVMSLVGKMSRRAHAVRATVVCRLHSSATTC